jgi:hypothetical protein
LLLFAKARRRFVPRTGMRGVEMSWLRNGVDRRRRHIEKLHQRVLAHNVVRMPVFKRVQRPFPDIIGIDGRILFRGLLDDGLDRPLCALKLNVASGDVCRSNRC